MAPHHVGNKLAPTGGSDLGQLALVAHTRAGWLSGGPSSAPGRAQGCPKHRSAVANQPLGPRWPAISAISALLRHRLRSASQPDYPTLTLTLTLTLTPTLTLTLTLTRLSSASHPGGDHYHKHVMDGVRLALDVQAGGTPPAPPAVPADVAQALYRASLGRHAPAERAAAAPAAAAPAAAPSAAKEPSSPRAQPSSPSSQRGSERGAGGATAAGAGRSRGVTC